MWIYKIINDINGKMYIGQTRNPIEERFKRHINDAMNNILDTHFARAIRKYGPEHFHWFELESGIEDEQTLTEREHYWIIHFNSVNLGYNETDAMYKCGGNTYMSKTEEEMEIIKEKIRLTKLGGLNPHATSIKMINIQTKEEKIFTSQQECVDYLGIKNHTAISRRCRGKIEKPLKGIYKFEYL